MVDADQKTLVPSFIKNAVSCNDWNLATTLLLNKLEILVFLEMELMVLLEQILCNVGGAKELARREEVAKWGG